MLQSSDRQGAIRLGLRVIHELTDQPRFPPVRIAMHTGPALSSDGDW
jgi:class 3 adenylate cyclase